MAGVSANAAALVALVSVLLTYGCCAQSPLNYTGSLAKASKASWSWLPAKATWYGAPTGAGPDDNGTCICSGGGRRHNANLGY